MILGLPKRALIIAAVLVGVSVIYIMGGEPRAGGSAGGGSTHTNGPGCQFTVSADVLNVRAEPSIRSKVIRQLTQDETVDARPTVRNGFRKLADDGWVYEEYIPPVEDAPCR